MQIHPMDSGRKRLGGRQALTDLLFVPKRGSQGAKQIAAKMHSKGYE